MPDWLKALGIAGPAEVKTYAAAGQALVLMGFVPAYSWFASRVDRMKLVFGVTAFFVANILLFAFAVHADVDHIGVFFYVWVGLFSLSIVAQFWSYANDIYTKDAGNRLFPIIGVGMTAGSPVGAWIAGRMFHAHLSPHLMLYVAAALLLTTAGLYVVVNRNGAGPRQAAAAKAAIGGKGAFSLVFASRYIKLIVVLLIVLNIVNTVGEYILSHMVVAHAAEAVAADPSFDKNAYIGAFYGSYFLWVNIAAVVLQMLVAPRLVKRFGLAGVLFALPLIVARRLRVRGARRDHRHRALGEDRRELHRLLGDEHREAVAVAADVARGEVQGQAGGGQLLRPPRRHDGGVRRVRRHELAGPRGPRVRHRQRRVRPRLAGARVRPRPREPPPVRRQG